VQLLSRFARKNRKDDLDSACIPGDLLRIQLQLRYNVHLSCEGFWIEFVISGISSSRGSFNRGSVPYIFSFGRADEYRYSWDFVIPGFVISRFHCSCQGRIRWRISARAEFSARRPEQISLKRRLRLHEESFSPGRFHKPGWKFQLGQTGWKTSRNRIQISTRAEIWTLACAPLELWM